MMQHCTYEACSRERFRSHGVRRSRRAPSAAGLKRDRSSMPSVWVGFASILYRDREDFWDPAVPSCIKASRVPGGSRLWLMVVGVGLMGWEG